MVIFANFKGFKNSPKRLVWDRVVNEMGESIQVVLSKRTWTTDIIKLKFGNRYKIDYDEVKEEIIEIRQVKRMPKCDIFRPYKDEIHIIGGKHQGKKTMDLDKHELNQYCIWLVRNSYNEVTIKNALYILKKMHDE